MFRFAVAGKLAKLAELDFRCCGISRLLGSAIHQQGPVINRQLSFLRSAVLCTAASRQSKASLLVIYNHYENNPLKCKEHENLHEQIHSLFILV